MSGGASDHFSVRTRTGHTVMEIIRAVEAATGSKVPYMLGPRRDGEAPRGGGFRQAAE